MAEGIIYVMTTALAGVIKIGKAESKKNYQERVRKLGTDGYQNVTKLEECFAVQIKNHSEREKLIHELLNYCRVGARTSELFQIDVELIKKLLLELGGRVIFSRDGKNQLNKSTGRAPRFNFYRKGIKEGEYINFSEDESISLKVVAKNKVEYKGKILELSPVVREIKTEKGEVTPSGSYDGPKYFMYNGKKLLELPDVSE